MTSWLEWASVVVTEGALIDFGLVVYALHCSHFHGAESDAFGYVFETVVAQTATVPVVFFLDEADGTVLQPLLVDLIHIIHLQIFQTLA